MRRAPGRTNLRNSAALPQLDCRRCDERPCWWTRRATLTSRRWPAVIDADEQFYFKPEAGKLLLSPADETPTPPCDAQPDETRRRHRRRPGAVVVGHRHPKGQPPLGRAAHLCARPRAGGRLRPPRARPFLVRRSGGLWHSVGAGARAHGGRSGAGQAVAAGCRAGRTRRRKAVAPALCGGAGRRDADNGGRDGWQRTWGSSRNTAAPRSEP